MIKAIIFDCFSVLVGDATKQLVAALPEDAYKEFSGVAHAVDKGIISDEEACVEQSRILGMSLEGFNELRARGEVPNDELLAYAESLKGDFQLGVLSNIASTERMAMRFHEGQLERLFDVVVASGEVGYIKPQPEIFQLAADRLGVLPEECIMIDDILDNCEGAKSIGMHAVHFTSNPQAIAEVTALIDRGGESD